jgi:hypothetical protein
MSTGTRLGLAVQLVSCTEFDGSVNVAPSGRLVGPGGLERQPLLSSPPPLTPDPHSASLHRVSRVCHFVHTCPGYLCSTGPRSATARRQQPSRGVGSVSKARSSSNSQRRQASKATEQQRTSTRLAHSLTQNRPTPQAARQGKPRTVWLATHGRPGTTVGARRLQTTVNMLAHQNPHPLPPFEPWCCSPGKNRRRTADTHHRDSKRILTLQTQEDRHTPAETAPSASP